MATALAVALPGSAMAGENAQAPLLHVGPNPVTCDQGAGGPVEGNTTVHSTPSGHGIVNVVIRDGLPNTSYFIDYRCFFAIGNLTTNSRGTGTAHIYTALSPAAAGVGFIDVATPLPQGGLDTYVSEPLSFT
jgi:hypothetical protein